MRSLILAAAAVALALPMAAQAAPNAAKPSQATRVTRQAIKADLTKAGFTNIEVRPVAFVARATDKNGHLVLMAFRPHSFQAVTQLSTNGSAANNGSNGQHSGQNSNNTGDANTMKQ